MRGPVPQQLRVVHTIASLSAEHGGPSRSVTSLAGALAELGVDSHIVTMSAASEGDPIRAKGRVVKTVASRPRSDVRLLFPFSTFERALTAAIESASTPVVVHDHGLWLPSNHLVARISRSHRVPRVVSVRGMLSDWAIAQGRLRKSIAWRLYQRRDLLKADAVHVTSDLEARELSRLVQDADVVEIPNGVDVPIGSDYENCSDPGRRALFLSRVHPKKGLEALVEVWSLVRPEGWQLVIAGPGESRYVASLRNRVNELGLEETVDLIGPIGDDAKWDLYREADLFVLPTHSENFGLVVAEALASGTPVITTHGAPWEELETNRCGWWVPVGVEPLTQALREATSLERVQLREMGERGRALVAERYSWTSVGERMLEAYRSIARD